MTADSDSDDEGQGNVNKKKTKKKQSNNWSLEGKQMYNKFFQLVKKNREEFGERFNVELANKLKNMREIQQSNERSRRGKEKEAFIIMDDLDTLTDEVWFKEEEYDPKNAEKYFSQAGDTGDKSDLEMMEDDDHEDDLDEEKSQSSEQEEWGQIP